MKRKKISIIGAGFVGSTLAHWIALKQLGDIILLDINEKMAQGKALDLFQSLAVEGVDVCVQGTQSYEDIRDSDFVVITAGSPRKKGMTRDDLLQINAQVVTTVCQQVKEKAPHAFVIVVSNPLDAMVCQAYKILNFEKKRVIGMAGILDTARFRAFLSMELGVSVKDIQTMVLGGHGDTMVPVLSQTFIGGRSIYDELSLEKIKKLVERTQKGGGEIVQLLQTGSAYFAPARGATEMIESILFDQKRILPCTVLLEGEFGYKDIFIGVPCLLGGQGVEKVIETSLTDEEKQQFQKSVKAIRDNQDRLKEICP